jgi:hypothetical protein
MGVEKNEVNLLPRHCNFSLEQGNAVILPGFVLKIIGKWIPPVINASFENPTITRQFSVQPRLCVLL